MNAIAQISRFASSSVVKKVVMAMTGLLLVGFLVGHLTGNFLLMVSNDAFNLYAYKLTSTPLIYVAEAGLMLLFLTHLGVAIKLTIENKVARGQSYYLKSKTGRGATFASSTMIFTGLVILVFIVLHILHFKFGTVYYTQVDGITMRDLAKTVFEYFVDPLNVVWYVAAMTCLAIHLVHGIQSAFQSLGISHKKYNCPIRLGSKVLAVVLAIGFSSLAVYGHLLGGQ